MPPSDTLSDFLLTASATARRSILTEGRSRLHDFAQPVRRVLEGEAGAPGREDPEPARAAYPDHRPPHLTCGAARLVPTRMAGERLMMTLGSLAAASPAGVGLSFWDRPERDRSAPTGGSAQESRRALEARGGPTAPRACPCVDPRGP